MQGCAAMEGEAMMSEQTDLDRKAAKTLDDLQGIPAVQWAVTFASQVLSGVKQEQCLDSRCREDCERAQRWLEKAEKVLYGK